MEKIKIRQAVVVEGKYDKIKLSAIIDGVIICTDGFGLYRNKETTELIRFYAKNCGIAILTDSDSAGQQIRGHIKSIVPEGRIINVYVPEIFGKEKRKSLPSKEGKIGVEGMSYEVIIRAFEKAGLTDDIQEPREKISKMDFYEMGLSGASESSFLRRRIARHFDLPSDLSASALRDAINTMFCREDFISFFENYIKEQDNG